jgi:hypothetical protein
MPLSKELKEKVVSLEATAKLQANEKPKLRFKAMERSFKNTMCLLKARLNESEAEVNEEMVHAEEEQRISRGMKQKVLRN